MAGPKKRAQKQSGARGVYRINRGDAITADYLNRVGDAAALLVGRVRAPQRIASDEVEPQAELSQAGTGGGTDIRLMQYVNASTGNPATFQATPDGTTFVEVRYPLVFDATIWTQEPATKTTGGEILQVHPPYGAGPICVANIGDGAEIDGGTGIAGVLWIDLNVHGRTWFEQLNSPLPT